MFLTATGAMRLLHGSLPMLRQRLTVRLLLLIFGVEHRVFMLASHTVEPQFHGFGYLSIAPQILQNGKNPGQDDQ